MEPQPRIRDGITYRPLAGYAEYNACVSLQRETWGRDFADVVPPTILKVGPYIGGVSAGAFDASGALLGFVFGLTGVRAGRIVHWSDMLAVRPEAQNLGIGWKLKLYQRELLLPIGVELVYWTYDPLVARNAHLNLNKLGAFVDEYVENMYGEPTSDLHQGLGTDRFIVAWPIAEPAIGLLLAGEPRSLPQAARDAPIVNPAIERLGVLEPGEFNAVDALFVRIEIPEEIQSIKHLGGGLGRRWRETTRAAIRHYLGRGYAIRRMCRTEDHRCYYIAERTS